MMVRRSNLLLNWVMKMCAPIILAVSIASTSLRMSSIHSYCLWLRVVHRNSIWQRWNEWSFMNQKEQYWLPFQSLCIFHQLVKGKRFMRLWTNNIITNIMTTHTVTCLVRKLFAFRRTANNHTSKIKENYLWKTLTLYFCFLLHFKTWSTLPWK